MKILCLLLLGTISGPVARTAPASELMMFFSGAAAAYVAHESGHALVAGVLDIDVRWEVGGGFRGVEWVSDRDLDGTAGGIFAGAGMATQVVLSELILNSDLDKNSNFVRGLMAWNIINPIQYALRYWMTHDQGDVRAMEQSVGRRGAELFAVGMAAIALAQGYRFLSTQSWAPSWAQDGRCDFSTMSGEAGALAVGFSVRF